VIADWRGPKSTGHWKVRLHSDDMLIKASLATWLSESGGFFIVKKYKFSPKKMVLIMSPAPTPHLIANVPGSRGGEINLQEIVNMPGAIISGST